MTHSPTPWVQNGGHICDTDKRKCHTILGVVLDDQKDTDFMLEAVNNHDRLQQEVIHYSELHNESIQEIACLKQENEYLIQELESSGTGWTRDQIPKQLLKEEE